MLPSHISGFIILYLGAECKNDPPAAALSRKRENGGAEAPPRACFSCYSIGRLATTKFLRQ